MLKLNVLILCPTAVLPYSTGLDISKLQSEHDNLSSQSNYGQQLVSIKENGENVTNCISSVI